MTNPPWPPYGAPWPQFSGPQPPPRRGVARWWVLGTAVLAVAIVVTAIVVTSTSGSSTSAPSTPAASTQSSRPKAAAPPTPESVVPPTALDGMLLSTAEINTLLATRGVTIDLNFAGPYNNTIDKPECGGVWGPGMAQAYAGSGWVAMRSQFLREPVTAWTHGAWQSVASFPTDAAANEYVAKESSRWTNCADKGVRMSSPDVPSENWKILDPSNSGGILTVATINPDVKGWGCQRALTAKRNVVVDTKICSYSGSNQAKELAQNLVARIPMA